MVPGLYNVELLETMEPKKKKRGKIEECVGKKSMGYMMLV
jgi:hypothetical protein